MRAGLVGAALAAGLASGAWAGDKPLYRPAPDWVKPVPPIDPAKVAATPGATLVFDQQQRLLDGEVWSYVDSASRILSEQMLAQAGTISLAWQPDQGDLIVHRIVIVRGDQQIDVIAGGQPLTVLRRELGLESLALDGMLTATMPVPGLRVGDILRVSFSTTRKDPLLDNHMQSIGLLLTEPNHADTARLRMLWRDSDGVRWQALSPTAAAPVSLPGGMRELSVTLPLPKPKELPDDAPARYRPLPLLEVSSFPDWASVSATTAKLFIAKGQVAPGGSLAKEIARIKAASADPRVRAAMALRSVQSDVRYLFNGLNNGNYKPQPAETTWQLRYGDCKAKTLLLLAMLDGLGVEAEPVLTHTQASDFLPKRLPSMAAFDHIFVRATIAGQTYWLDGTAGGARLADLGDTPALRYVLPVRAGGATLMPVPIHANARPAIRVDLDVDLTAGAWMPAPFSASVTFIGGFGEALRTAANGLTGDKRKEELDKALANFLPNPVIAERSVTYDADAGTATLHASGVFPSSWQRPQRRYELWPKTVVDVIKFDGVRGRPEWREIPVGTPGVTGMLLHTSFRLPNGGKGFSLDNDKALPQVLGGRPVSRTVTMANGSVVIDERCDEIAAEIAPADLPATKSALSLAKSRPLKIVAPADYPLHWQVVRDARAAGRLKAIEAALTQAIADATEKAPAYFNRARYFASVFDHKAAIADIGRAIAERGELSAYRSRANLLWSTGQDALAVADLKTAYDLDPSASSTIVSLSLMQARNGERDAALARLDERIEAGGEDKRDMQIAKSELLANAGQTDAAIAVLDAALTEKPGNAELLNARCWVKGWRNVQLDTALKDCNRAIDLGGEDSAATLHSRAVIYFRLGRLAEALADLDNAIDSWPEFNDAHMLRGIIRLRQGDKAGAEIDLAQARTADPRLDADYREYGIKS